MLRLMLSLLLTATLLSGTVQAYTYGPAEAEPVADAYTAALAAVNTGDWAKAKEAYLKVQAEIEKDAGGPAATAAWNAAVEAKNADAARQVFQGIVVLNVKRRLHFARQDINDYAKAKMLVGRAQTTYEALSPAVKAKDAKLDTDLRRKLEHVFDLLGNPGVLGVGAKPPKPEEFDKTSNEILAALTTHFPVDFAAIAKAHGLTPKAAGGQGGAAGQPVPTNWLLIAIGAAAAIVLVVLALRRRKRS